MPDYHSDKTVLRRALLERRAGIASDVRRQWDAAIADHLLAWFSADPVNTLGVYWPIRGEPDLHFLYAELATRGIQLALPIVEAKDTPLRFVTWTPGDAMVKDAMSITVPADTSNTVHPEALLIPCLGFNAENVRLGYGGGFYDRTLAATPRPVTLGIAYSCMLAQFEAAPHDVPLDRVVTEVA
jgi:5,10-methenyltetrahydrofolate synthetase